MAQNAQMQFSHTSRTDEMQVIGAQKIVVIYIRKTKKLHNWQPQDADLRVTNIGANLPSHAPTIAEAVANTTIRKYTRLAILQRESNVVWNSHSRNQAREPEENLRHGCEQMAKSAITYYCMVHKQVK